MKRLLIYAWLAVVFGAIAPVLAFAQDELTVTVEAGVVTLKWPKVEDAVWYNLYWKKADAPATTETKLVNVASPYELKDLPAGGDYKFRITAGFQDLEKDTGFTGSATLAPAPPQILDIHGAGKSVSILWDASAGAKHYRIYWNTTGGVTSKDKALTASQSPYTHKDLQPGGKYFYRIAAQNNGGEGELSQEYSAQLSAGTPVISSATANNGEVSIKWDAVPAAESYDLYWNTTGNVVITDSKIQFVSSVFIHTGLVRGGVYYYRLSARNTGGESELSPEVTVTIPPSPPVPKLHADSDTAVLKWDPVFGAESYSVYSDTKPGVTAGSKRASNQESPFKATDLRPGQTYYYRIAAVNAGGESLSEEVAVALRPTSPIILRTEAGVREITLFAQPVVGATGYNVYWNTRGNVNTSDQKIIDIGLPYKHVSLANGTTYYYRMSAQNVAGESALSPEMKVTLAPDAPVFEKVEGAEKRVTMKWEAVKGADNYAIYWNNTGNVTTRDRRMLSPLTQFEHGPLDNGTRYFYRLAAVNAGGESELGPEMHVTLAPDAPAAKVDKTGDTSVTLAWSEVKGASTYQVYWNTVGKVSTRDKKIERVKSPFTHDKLDKGETYYYVVTALNEGGESVSAPIQATLIPDVPPVPVLSGGDKVVTMSWKAVNGATTYRVYWNETGKVTASDATFDTSAATYAQGERTNGKTYYYRVAAVNSGGVSALSPEGKVTLAPDAPVFDDAAGGNRETVLKWSPVLGATSYRVYWTLGDALGETPKKFDSATSPFRHSELTNGLTYTYVVSASNAGGETRSAPRVVTLKPDAPVIGTLLNGDKRATIQWSAPPGVTGYTLYWNETGNVTATDARIDNAVSPFAHEALRNGGTYHYRIVARNAAGDSPLSQEGKVTLAPDAPAILKSKNGDRISDLEWTPMFCATEYKIYWNTIGKVSAKDKALRTTASQITHTDLSRGATYYYRVAAANTGGETLSEEFSVTLAPDSTEFVVVKGSDKQVTLSWKPSSGATAYHVYWNAKGSVTEQDAKLESAATTLLHTRIQNGSTYRYRVAAVNSGGSSGLSPEMQVTLAPDAPVFAEPKGEDKRITVAWGPSVGATSYTLYFKRADARTTRPEKIENVTSPYEFKNLVNGTKYVFTVSATNAGGEGFTSEQLVAAPHARILFGLFHDPALQQCINSEAGANKWTYADDVSGILVCNSLGIRDLSGIEWLENMTNLSVRGNDLSDLAPLSRLTGLTFLALDNNKVSDIGQLSGLSNLNYLSLSGNPISHIAPVSSLKQLTSLYLNETKVSDLSPLQSLGALVYLAANNANLTDLQPLAGLRNLERLYVSGNQIVDVGALSTLTKLVELDVSRNEVGGKNKGNVASLRALRSLQILHLYDNDALSCDDAASLVQALGSPPVDLDSIPTNSDAAVEGENCVKP